MEDSKDTKINFNTFKATVLKNMTFWNGFMFDDEDWNSFYADYKEWWDSQNKGFYLGISPEGTVTEWCEFYFVDQRYKTHDYALTKFKNRPTTRRW